MDVYSATNLPATTFATSTVAAGPTTVPTAAPYVHAACYVDNLNGRLLGVAEDDNTGSIELCASHCVAAAGGPYAYFGMEYYSQCMFPALCNHAREVVGPANHPAGFCGNAYNESAPASTGCSFPCAGNGGEICGGSNAMDLYYNTQLVATAPPRPTPT
ncbi:hypothetical protein MMC27_006955 [Xylographa pallens]|nr:hypothetical protein [Xylographa pallens]